MNFFLSKSALQRPLASALLALSVAAASSVLAQNINLSELGTTHPGFVINGATAFDNTGFSVSGAGDVNGDGFADLIVGAPNADPYNQSKSGMSYVVFGKTRNTPVDLSSVELFGFKTLGIDAEDYSGVSVSAAGDVNNDGLADLIVGVSGAEANGDDKAGEAYVVFGKNNTASVSLGSLYDQGFRISGIDAGDQVGLSVAGAGDVNGDGFADLIVGARYAGDGNYTAAGETFVVFGKANSDTIELDNLGEGGFRIDGEFANEFSGFSVSGAGDVNGDGLADLIIGAAVADDQSRTLFDTGKAFVVFGKVDSNPLYLGNLGGKGFRIIGKNDYDNIGRSISGAGDVNGDGLADLIIGAPFVKPGTPSRDRAGESYVVFGKADDSTIQLSSLGTGGFTMEGIDAIDNSGWSVAGAGDVNGDGLADVIVGAIYSTPEGSSQAYAGESYVVYGKGDSETISFSNLGTAGFRIIGIDGFDYAGRSVSGAGDVNGDGLADLVVGADKADPYDKDQAGESYVIFSTAMLPTSATYFAKAFPGNPPRQAIGITGDGSNDSTPDGRAFIDFSDGTTTSTQTVTLTRNNQLIENLPNAADVMWQIESDRLGWTNAQVKFNYTSQDIAGLLQDSLTLYSATSPSGPWTPVPNQVNELERNQISGTAERIGYFALAGELAPPPSQVIELSELGSNYPGFVINGIADYDLSGRSVSGAGDVNGDGLADLIIGADNADPNGFELAGESYVVFGKADNTPIELSEIGNGGGFRIVGIDSRDESGISVSGAGDVNGDGLADLIVGARSADPNQNYYAGESYVVFGKSNSEVVLLGNLGAGGFRIEGIDQDDFSGSTVSGAGDVNGDGLSDVIIAAYSADPNGLSSSGESYVVFGKTNTSNVSLENLGNGGFQINGKDSNNFAGGGVSGAGDVNGDGLADIIVGAFFASPNGDTYAGESYVVFGKTDTSVVNLVNLDTGGFRIDGIDAEDRSGRSVSGAGDVNGDGLADLIIGAYGADPNGNSYAGESYVVFGKADNSSLDLANLGIGGFTIQGSGDYDSLGRSVSGAGDVNGDGFADLLVGAQNADSLKELENAGESYLIYGSGSSETISLSALGSRGFQINGIERGDQSGRSLSAAGDVNGDGLADLIIGAYLADPGTPNRTGAGESYVLFSTAMLPESATYFTKALPGNAPRQAISIVGDGSNDSTPDGRVFIDFADGTTTSTQTVTLTRNNFAIQDIPKPATVMWELSTNRTDWTSAEVTFRYTDAEIEGLDEFLLTLYTAETPYGPWSPAPNNTLDANRQEITGTVTNLGYFSIAEFFTPPVIEVIELSELGTTYPGFVINGASLYDNSGISVSGAGDVNGDGLADVIVGASKASPNGETYAGESYVVFGKTNSNPVDLSNLGSGGFRISGIKSEDQSGFSVSGAGDVNGDGLADLIVGARDAGELIPDSNGGFYSSERGQSYVIFGKADSTEIDLENLGNGGFQFNGVDIDDNSGFSVSGAGDINGDGLADLIVGALQADPSNNSRAGQTYVVFGKTDSATIELSTLGSGGFLIDGIVSGDESGYSVSGVGDVNGDGLADLILGAPRANPNDTIDAGESYVVFGKIDSTRVELSNLGSGGFRINGDDNEDLSGFAVSGAGDVNGDGLADLIVGARWANLNGKSDAGESYVIFGKSDATTVELGNLETRGFMIEGINAGDNSGRSVSGAGDINGDGLADLMIGAFLADPDGNEFAGESYVVFGKADNSTVALSNLGTAGFRIEGINAYDYSGISVSGAGDVNGDGLADLIIGANEADPNGFDYAGESYVLFSNSMVPDSASYRNITLAGNAPRQAIGITGDGSNDSTPDGRAFIDFADGANTSTQTVTLFHVNGDVLNLTDLANVVWEVSTDRTSWSSAQVSFKYADFEIAGLAEADLLLYQAPTLEGPWLPVAEFTRQPERNQITGTVSTLGYFTLSTLPPAEPVEVIELSALGTTYPGFVINGATPNDNSGISVSGAGDVNGDGLADVIVGANNANPNGENYAGESYVVFGKTDSTPVDLSNLGVSGFSIPGIDAYDRAGYSVSGAGDVNGDGLADLIVGASNAGPNGGDEAGESYIVFGKADTEPVDLENLGSGGFQINGIDLNDNSGDNVSGAGDVNGDGLADLIIGAPFGDPNGTDSAGESYVVFGKTTSTLVELSTLGDGGFLIEGANIDDLSGHRVSGAGDFNGDGLADVIIGAYEADPNGNSEAGSAYLVFGKTDSTTVALSNLGTSGLRIDGIDPDDRLGHDAAGAGDVNGDGLADLIVTAYSADFERRDNVGETYVLFGKTTLDPIDLTNLGTGGFRIDGINNGDFSGYSAAGAGDLNGDGLGDLIIGAFGADPNGNSRAGESYVVFGKADATPIELRNLGSKGYRIHGIDSNDESGVRVSGAGDVNGDGLADVIIGANNADPNGFDRAGESYVLFSNIMLPNSASYLSNTLAGNAPRQAISIIGDGSNDSTPDSRTFIDFADGITLSTQTVTLTRSNSEIFNLSKTADVLWEVTTDRTGWTNAEVTFKYLDSEITNLNEAELKLFQASALSGPWTEVSDAILNQSRNQIKGTVSNLGFFAIGDTPPDIDVKDAWTFF